MENAFLLNESRFEIKTHDETSGAWKRERRLRPRALFQAPSALRRLWRFETKRRYTGEIRRFDVVT
jgi:hypothetical protein